MCGRFEYRVEMIRNCRHKEHIKAMGPEDEIWYRNIEEAIEHYTLWFHQIGHDIWNGDRTDCCNYQVYISTKKCFEFFNCY